MVSDEPPPQTNEPDLNLMNHPRQYVTLFSGARDDYQFAIAAAEADLLERHISEVYFSKDLVDRLASDSRLSSFARRRSHALLPAQKVQSVPKALALSLVDRWVARLRRRVGLGYERRALAQAAAQAAVDTGSGIAAYSYNWPDVWKLLKRTDGFRGPSVVFQVHPPPSVVRRVLAESRQVTGQTWAREWEERLAPAEVDSIEQSLRAADRLICASTFVKDSLTEIGIEADRISIAPYGVKCPVDRSSAIAGGGDSQRLQVLFVGQGVYRKGLHTLVEALGLVPPTAVDVTVVARGGIMAQIAGRVRRVAKVYDGLSATDLSRAYASADVLVAPSLIEGFGHVILEAMAHGTPVIASSNTAAPDLIREGVTGWIVPADSPTSLARRLSESVGSVDVVRTMRARVRSHAEEWTWKRFRQAVAEALMSA